jgi:transcriptional regulator with XRE-family HTH domain
MDWTSPGPIGQDACRMENRVRDERVRRLWTQPKLARKADVDLSTITRAEKGLPLSPLSEERIARAFGLERRDLFPEPDEPEEAAV